jgi:hypothetical protein
VLSKFAMTINNRDAKERCKEKAIDPPPVVKEVEESVVENALQIFAVHKQQRCRKQRKLANWLTQNGVPNLGSLAFSSLMRRDVSNKSVSISTGEIVTQ